ncbi:hypothetical protein K492DRAFT_205750 [Lichtheimia hyalospora FSU 10163]|nr:hypothetical protein K492DRAFT_205750 [Lichtheimia hyalospora FSU 10163]
MSEWEEACYDDFAISQPPLKRTRAKRSCDLCRKRKTRCNADQQQPCETCKNANVECHFVTEQRKKGPAASTSHVQWLEDRINRLEGILQGIQPERKLSNNVNDIKLTDYGQTRYFGSSAGIHMVDEQLLSSKQPHRLHHSPAHVLQKVNDESSEHIVIMSKALVSRQQNPVPYGVRRFHVFKDVPHMTPELADAMVYAYFQYVHPHLPVLHKMSFLEQYYFENPQPPDENLLCAVCALATQFMVNEQDWIATGQSFTRDMLLDAQTALQRKSEKVLENIHRKSKLSTVQALILITMFMNLGGVEEDTSMRWFVCGTAIRMAQDIGLHRNSRHWKLPESEIELRRRVWYGLYIIDREVAAQFGRPVTIVDEDFNVEPPSPYELESTHESYLRDPEFQSCTPALMVEAQAAIQERRPVYDFFLECITLSKILGHILLSMYSPKTEYSARRNDFLILTIANQLAQWKAKLPPNLQFNPDEVSEMTLFSTAHLNIYYNCILLLLHRPFINSDASTDPILSTQSLTKCTFAAIDIVNTIEALETQRLPGMTWCFIAYAIFQSASIFLFNAKSNIQAVKRQGAEYLSRCAILYKQEESLRNGLHAHILGVLAAKFCSYHEPPRLCKWTLEPVERESSVEKYQRPSDKYSFGDTSERGLFYKALPHDNEAASRVSTNQPESSSTIPPQEIEAADLHPSIHGEFDPVSLPLHFNLSNAIEWKEWNDIINSSDQS